MIMLSRTCILGVHVGRFRIQDVYPVQLYMIMLSRTCILGVHVRYIRVQDVYDTRHILHLLPLRYPVLYRIWV